MKKDSSKLMLKSKMMAAIGVLLLSVALASTGCSSQQTASTAQNKSGQNQSQNNSNQSGNNQAGSGQSNQGRMQANPAVRAAMDILRLQRNQEMALTADQSSKIKPILQELINTSNPTEDFLQTKADAITSTFTEEQKSFLQQRPSGNGRPRRGGQNNNLSNGTNAANGTNSSDGAKPANGTDASNGNNGNGNTNPNGGKGGSRPSFDPKGIYQQALNALK